ncbi:MAG: aminotransferase class V-fold PLP-dependent enzyme [Vicinamibacterales bacterium]
MNKVKQAFAEFLTACPDYERTGHLDALRASEYRRLDAQGHVYLDYAGGSLHAESQVREHMALLNERVLGNPHSASLTSAGMTELVEGARQAVLTWFNAEGEYTAIFTQNATAALKHVGESYPFASGCQFLLTVDNHNSVNGIREFASAKGATVAYVPLTTPELRIDRARLCELLRRKSDAANNLFAFPAQSNFSGVKHSLEIVDEAHDLGWDVLLDAAAFVPTNALDLSVVRPDFVSISFYKMFGYPTGVGCLLVRHGALRKLHRPWFAGGTVNFASVQGRRHILAPGEAGFEDGTLNYLAIPGVEIGLRHLASIGIDTIQARVRCLTEWLLQSLLALRHGNGRPMARMYGPVTTAARGGTVTMNFYDPDGHLVDYRRVEELASTNRISLRTGCFCNPGAAEAAEGLTENDVSDALAQSPDMTLPRFLQAITHRDGKSAGAIRVSLGLASNFADVYGFVQFAAGLCDQTRLTIGEVTFDIESCRVIRDGS